MRFHPISGAEGSTWERHSGKVRTRDLSLKRDLLVLGRRTWPAQPINASPAAGRRLPLPRNLFRAAGQGEGQTSRNALCSLLASAKLSTCRFHAAVIILLSRSSESHHDMTCSYPNAAARCKPYILHLFFPLQKLRRPFQPGALALPGSGQLRGGCGEPLIGPIAAPLSEKQDRRAPYGLVRGYGVTRRVAGLQRWGSFRGLQLRK